MRCVVICILMDEDNIDKMGMRDKLKYDKITSQSNCNGAMIVLSFHVESTDEMRCYMYINGQVLRFMPEDIQLVLPLFFDAEFKKNKEFAQSEKAKKLVKKMKDNLRDVHFEAF